MKKHILNFGYALTVVVLLITGLGFIVGGIEVIIKLGSDYIPFIKIARECTMYWQAGAMIFVGVLAACLMGITWIAWNDEECARY